MIKSGIKKKNIHHGGSQKETVSLISVWEGIWFCPVCDVSSTDMWLTWRSSEMAKQVTHSFQWKLGIDNKQWPSPLHQHLVNQIKNLFGNAEVLWWDWICCSWILLVVYWHIFLSDVCLNIVYCVYLHNIFIYQIPNSEKAVEESAIA